MRIAVITIAILTAGCIVPPRIEPGCKTLGPFPFGVCIGPAATASATPTPQSR